MIEINVNGGEVSLEMEGKPLSLLAELTVGCAKALKGITDDCPDTAFKKHMIDTFINVLKASL